MRRSRSENNIDVPPSIDKDQNSWKFKSNTTLNPNYDSTDIPNPGNLEKSESNETKITTMDHSTNQPNILKLQLQQINNQITQLRLHLTTLTQLDNDSDEVITSIENIEDNINTLTQQKKYIEQEVNQSLEIANVFTNKIDIPELSKEDKQLNWKMIYDSLPQKIDGTNKQEFKAAWQMIKNIARTQKWSQKISKKP